MTSYRMLDVHDCQGTLWAFFRRYAGSAFASFEGDLSLLQLDEIPGATHEETPMLKRQTSSPELDFIVVPINERTVGMLKRQLSTRGVMGKDGVVIHTHIQASDEMIFSACDNFHKDCTVASKSVPEEFLASLKSHGLLRSYGDV